MPGTGTESHIAAITHAIQLAIAPVFMLTAIGTIINALTGRLARAVDRRRQIEEILGNYEGDRRAALAGELALLARRIVIVMRAIVLAVISAIFVCLLIGTAFAAAFTELDLSRSVALLFVASVAALTGALGFFMHEVVLAAQSVTPRMWPHPLREERSTPTAEAK
ncbi:MAG TPA: DUF2721 domain-containing protein [Usitatibacter sp.]|nr:DUF2721 domain-containing protein [Usitatibacter sp.]